MATLTEEKLDKQAQAKQADLAGPGIGNYKELEKILPNDYRSLLDRRDTQKAIYQVKRYIADNLCKALNLTMVEVPLIVDITVAICTTKIPILMKQGFWAMAHEARTDWCMLLGSVFLMLAGAGAWSIDAMLASDHRPRNHAGNGV